MVDYALAAIAIYGLFAILLLSFAYLLVKRSNHYPWSDRDLAEKLEARECEVAQRRRLVRIEKHVEALKA